MQGRFYRRSWLFEFESRGGAHLGSVEKDGKVFGHGEGVTGRQGDGGSGMDWQGDEWEGDDQVKRLASGRWRDVGSFVQTQVRKPRVRQHSPEARPAPPWTYRNLIISSVITYPIHRNTVLSIHPDPPYTSHTSWIHPLLAINLQSPSSWSHPRLLPSPTLAAIPPWPPHRTPRLRPRQATSFSSCPQKCSPSSSKGRKRILFRQSLSFTLYSKQKRLTNNQGRQRKKKK